jgi:phenylalanyl-tRNA synthetase beta chain
VDFHDLKGDIEALLNAGGEGEAYRFEAGERAGMHPGQTAWIYRGDSCAGYVAALHPSLQATLDLDRPVFVAELDLEVITGGRKPAFKPVSRFPALRRDLALIVDETVPAADLLAAVRGAAGAYVTDLTLFDVYQGKGIDPQRKSVALGLTFQDQSRTLDDDEVNRCVQQVIDSLAEKYNAELRA